MNKIYLLFLTFFLFTSHALAACTANLTVCSSGCDYTSLNDAVTDLETNCSSPTEPLSIEITDDCGGDDTRVTISGISTTATNNLTIYTSGTARHSGKKNSGNYVLRPTAYGSEIFVLLDNSYVTIDGLIFESNIWWDKHVFRTNQNRTGNIVKNNIADFTDVTGNVTFYTTFLYASGNTATAYNNIIIHDGGDYNVRGFDLNGNSGAIARIFNNTMYKLKYGVVGSANVNTTVYNNIAYDSNTADYSGTITTSSNNIDSDGSAEITASLTFVDAANGDFHLSASDTAAIDAGSDLSSYFTTDIDGDTRSGTWDIGSDEYIAAAVSGGIHIIGNRFTLNRGGIY
jgi:hypothetical protein